MTVILDTRRVLSRPVADRAGLPPFPVCRFTIDQYHRMIEAGIVSEDDRVELLRGWIVPKMGQNTPHKKSLPLSQIALGRALPPGWYLAVQQPVASGDDSEPEPDISVPRGSPRDYEDGTPGPRDIGLLVEVSDTSLEYDRDVKGPIYAEAGYAILWIVNLVDRKVEVYTDPSGPSENACYRQRRDYGENESVPLVLDGVEVGRIAVPDLLP